MIYDGDRIAVLVDGVGLHACAKALGFDVDFRRFKDHFASQGRLVRLGYYTTILEQDDHSSLRPLTDWLEYNGYVLKTKPAREFHDDSGLRKIKGSMTIEIAVDAMVIANRIDHLVLVSGDGDYRYLIKHLQSKGVRVTVCSSQKTSPSMVSDDLRRQTDDFLELDDLRPMIARVAKT